MKLKKPHLFLFWLISGALYSQTKSNPSIIRKEIKTSKGIDIVDYFDPNHPFTGFSSKGAKVPVYYKGKFYAQGFLKKINPDSIASIEVINIPDSISKDFRTFIYVRKKP